MHNFQSNGISFNYNSDCSGDVHITNVISGEHMEFPMDAILEFVGTLRLHQMISDLEQKSPRDILGL